ncbi:MAG: hypothetical protein AVDCRST_MAG40-3463, partial [uncultured Gemmatimonadaceae bacterium]
ASPARRRDLLDRGRLLRDRAVVHPPWRAARLACDGRPDGAACAARARGGVGGGPGGRARAGARRHLAGHPPPRRGGRASPRPRHGGDGM